MTQLVWRQLYPEPVEQQCHGVSWASSSLALNVGPSNLGLPLALARKRKKGKNKNEAGCVGKYSGKDLPDQTACVLWGLPALSK